MIQALERLHDVDVVDEYNGPQIVFGNLLNQRVLGVAVAEGRWVFAPVTESEEQALRSGDASLREALQKGLVWVADGDRVFVSAELSEEDLPDAGARLPVASERVALFAKKCAGLATANDEARLEVLTERMREDCPRVTRDDWERADRYVQVPVSTETFSIAREVPPTPADVAAFFEFDAHWERAALLAEEFFLARQIASLPAEAKLTRSSLERRQDTLRRQLYPAAAGAGRTIERALEALQESRARAVDVVCDELDELLLATRSEDAGALLLALSERELPLAVLLSALVVSYPWRETLGAARQALADKALSLAALEGEEKVHEVSKFV